MKQPTIDLIDSNEVEYKNAIIDSITWGSDGKVDVILIYLYGEIITLHRDWSKEKDTFIAPFGNFKSTSDIKL